MEISNNIRKAFPHLAAIILFIAISFAYFFPVMEGKVLKANDSTVSTINSKEIRDYREKFHKEPLWTNSIFCGMPAYLISTKYPGNLMKHVDTVLRVFQTPVSVLVLSMAGFYLLLLILGAGPLLSVAGAVAFGLSSFLFQILAAGHNTQAIALAYMAPVVGAIYYTYRRDMLKGSILTAIFLSLEILANHPQITYYLMICILVFITAEFVASIKTGTVAKFIRTTAILSIPVILALGINFANLYTVYEYGKYSSRGKTDLVVRDKNISSGLNRDYITYWSYGVDETLNLLVPDFKGGSSKPFNKDSETIKALRQHNAADASGQVMKYWGTQPGTDGPHYVGAIVIFLFILGLAVVRSREKWWLLIATLLSLMLAWGKNFMPFTNLFIDFFPGYNKFRAVTMILVISQFCIPLLGFIALRDLFSGKLSKKEIMKGLNIAAGVTGGLLLIFLLFPGIAGSFLNPYESQYPDWLRTALISDRKGLLRADSLRSLIFILLAYGTIMGFLLNKLKKEYSVVIVGLLIMFDLWTIDKRYLSSDRFEKPSMIQKSFAPSVADAEILKDKSYFRVFNISVSTFNDNSPTSYFHKSIGGYHGAKLKRYQELIDSALSRDIAIFTASARSAKSIEEIMPVINSLQIINMLNTKYIIFTPEMPPIVNKNALGNAWFVEKPRLVENANEELSAVNSINPSIEAVIDKKYKDQVKGTVYPVEKSDTIFLVSYQPDELVYKYSAGGEKLVVFSEIYYPAGWKCLVDGKETGYFRADYVLRAMIAPEGDHEIRFVFHPSSYYTGNKVSLASSVILLLLIAGFGFNELRKKSKAS